MPVPTRFFTPGMLAICTFWGSLAESSHTPYLTCSKLRRAVTVLLKAKGRPLFWPTPFSVNGFGPPSYVLGLLRFGKTWWGDGRGDEGTGRSKGRILFRCASRESGLTCRSRSGHGFWLGRTLGYRVF